MSYRAGKSGLAAECKEKTDSKYEAARAEKCLNWISQKIGENFNTSGDPANFHEQLKNGFYLAKLTNGAVKTGSAPQKLAFKQMETIGQFLNWCKANGVAEYECFQTVDLYEAQNLNQVVTCLTALARKEGSFGPKEAKANKREFTDEQLKAGQGIIGLQMGTNKGANQSGMNIGNTRHIVD